MPARLQWRWSGYLTAGSPWNLGNVQHLGMCGDQARPGIELIHERRTSTLHSVQAIQIASWPVRLAKTGTLLPKAVRTASVLLAPVPLPLASNTSAPLPPALATCG